MHLNMVKYVINEHAEVEVSECRMFQFYQICDTNYESSVCTDYIYIYADDCLWAC